MKIVLAGIVFSVFLLGVAGLGNVFAATIDITDEASCQAAGGSFFDSAFADSCFFGSLTVNADDTLRVENVFLSTGAGGLTNLGNIIMVGGDETNSGALATGQGGDVLNECGASITLEGFDGQNSASFSLSDGVTLTNLGTLNLNGGEGQTSGGLLIGPGAAGNNHGIINEKPGGGPFSGVVTAIASGVFNDNLPNNCPSEIVVGGEFLPIDSTALVLAGLQSSAVWMLPILAGAAGAGFAAFKLRRK